MFIHTLTLENRVDMAFEVASSESFGLGKLGDTKSRVMPSLNESGMSLQILAEAGMPRFLGKV